MTLIVGIVDKETGTVYMGGDRIVCYGMDKKISATPKIFRKGEFLIGSAGYVRGMNLLEFMFETPSIKDDNIVKYMVKEFVPELIKCFKENQFSSKENEIITNEQEILIGVRGKLFIVGGGFEVSEVMNNYAAVGYGSYHANGALEYAIKTQKTINYADVVKDVIRNTCKIVNYVDLGGLDVDLLELKKIKEVKQSIIYIFEDGTELKDM